MNTNRFFIRSLLIASVIVLMPFYAHAQAAIQQTPASPKAGVTTYSRATCGNASNCDRLPEFTNDGVFADTIKAEAWAHGNVSLDGAAGRNSCTAGGGELGQTLSPTLYKTQQACYKTGISYPDNYYIQDASGRRGPPTTANRMCQIADTFQANQAGYTPDSNPVETSMGYDEEASNGNEDTLLFDGSQWYLMNDYHYYYIPGYVSTANGGAEDFHGRMDGLTCKTYDLPGNTLTANTYSVTSGAPVALTWSDLKWADNYGGNFGSNIDTAGKCTADFPLTGGSGQYCSHTTTVCDGQSQAAAEVAIVNQGCHTECDEYRNYSYTNNSGTATVNPAATTTYHYTCTNANGTTVASAKVSVTGAVAAPVISAFAANPTTVNQGDPSTLTWTTQNATSCVGGGGSGDFSTGNATTTTTGVVVHPAVMPTSTYSLTCYNANGDSVIAYAPITVNASTNPDLTASSVTPNSAKVSTATTFSATISNGGTGSAAHGAQGPQVLWQVDGDSNHTTVDSQSTTRLTSPIAGSGNATAQKSLTFSSIGTSYVRACADPSGEITESDETNNCGSWSAVTVSSSAPTGVTCAPTSQTISEGDTATWSATGGNPYTWYDALGNIIGSGATLTKKYNTAGNYAVHVKSGGIVSSDCSLTVQSATGTCSLSESGTLTASPTRVKQGDSVALNWTGIQGVQTSCDITNTPDGPFTADDTCSITDGSRISPAITTQTTFSLVCDGKTLSSVIVDVLPNFHEF